MKSQAKTEKTGRVEDYSYHVRWYEPDKQFVGTVDEFPSLSGMGPSLEKALREIKFVVGMVLEDLHENGEEIPEPISRQRFSGKFALRIPPELHRSLVEWAMREHSSLNKLIASILARAVSEPREN